MPFKVAGLLATLVVAVSPAAQHREEASNAGSFGQSIDMISVILSFFAPMEWSQLRFVSALWNEALKQSVHHYFRYHGTPVDPAKGYPFLVCSAQYTIEAALKSVMDQPGFRGAIFNKDECTLINHSLRGSQVCFKSGFKGKVRVTGVADADGRGPYDISKCNDYFLYRTDDNTSLHARKIHTGQDFIIREIHLYEKATLANEKQLVIVQKDQLLLYELDWDANTAECILREPKEIITPYRSQILMDDSGVVSSILCRTHNGYYDFNIESKQWKMIPKTKSLRTDISPDGKNIFRSDDGMIIESTDGETTLLKIPGHWQFHPSLDSRFVGISLSSKQCMMNLQSSEITVIPDFDRNWPIGWFSDNLFRMKCKDGRSSLRSAHNPCVDLLTLNEDYSMIERVKVDDEVDARDLFYDLRAIGPNLYYSSDYHKVIQVQWMDNHKH